MINRGLGFFACCMIWLLAHPLPPPLPTVRQAIHRNTEKERQLADGRVGGRRRGQRTRFLPPREGLDLYNHSILPDVYSHSASQCLHIVVVHWSHSLLPMIIYAEIHSLFSRHLLTGQGTKVAIAAYCSRNQHKFMAEVDRI
jgi:hypothetical protein